jgi:hypothetical protein
VLAGASNFPLPMAVRRRAFHAVWAAMAACIASVFAIFILPTEHRQPFRKNELYFVTRSIRAFEWGSRRLFLIWLLAPLLYEPKADGGSCCYRTQRRPSPAVKELRLQMTCLVTAPAFTAGESYRYLSLAKRLRSTFSNNHPFHPVGISLQMA